MNNHNDDEMISPPSSFIKTKAVVLSSSNIAAAAGTDIRSVKKEEEDKSVNNHDDDDDDDKTSRRRIRVLQVKKEDDPDNEPKPNIDDDYDYSDWKAGDWCWLLPANKNKNNNNNNISNRTQQLESQNNTNLNRRRRCVKTEDDDDDINSNVNVSNRSMADDGEDGEVLSSAPPKKKTRRCRQLNADTNTVSSIKQEECTDNDESFVATSVNHDDDVDDDYNENSNNSIKEKEQGTTNNEHENERCDGYESWTEGNWCLILPLPHDDNGTSKRQLSSEVIPVTTEASTTTTLTRCRPSNESNKSTKKRKSHTRYTKAQNGKWHGMFRQLVAYKKEHKSTSVPCNYQADPKLGNWVSAQRTFYNKKELSEERINLLESICFVWKVLERLPWDEMFQRLVRYKMEHNSTNVPQLYIADPKLGGWVHKQRHLYSNKQMYIERINRLESIGFFWDPRDAKWMEMYQKLVAYKKQYNSTQVPREYIKDHSLGNWVSKQRKVYDNTNSGILSKKRLELLNSINFVWSVK